MKRLLLTLVLGVLGACAEPGYELTLDLRVSTERRLLASVDALRLSAERDERVLVERRYPPTAGELALADVPHGPRTVVALEGTSTAGDVVARGRTCPFDFAERDGAHVALYFAPTNSFAPTAAPPAQVRHDLLALALPDGSVLLAGGAIAGVADATTERFSVAASSFSAGTTSLNIARRSAEAIEVPGVGALVLGGRDSEGRAIGLAEVYRFDADLFLPFESAALGARDGLRAVSLPSGGVLVTGGAPALGEAPLSTSALVRLRPDGTASVQPGPPLAIARREHAVVVASGVPVLFGGFGVDGAPLASIEVLAPDGGDGRPAFTTVAAMRSARAEATATLLDDGSVLVVGGAGDASGAALVDAELYNPVTRTTTSFPLAIARRRHSATRLPDGRVLIVGGLGGDGAPLATVELFIPGVGFVSERSLGSPRAGHRAIVLCDETVLVVGGGMGAEVYTAPP